MEQVSRDFVSRKIFYDDDNYEMFNQKREEFLDNLMDVNKYFAGPLKSGDLYVLRNRLGIGCEKKSILEIANALNREPNIITLIESEILTNVRNYYRIKAKKPKCLMSSLDVHPDRNIIYNMSLTNFDFDISFFKIVKQAINEYRLGYLLRYSKIGLNRKGINYRTFDHVVDAVHNLQGKFIDELSPVERLYVIRGHKLDSVLASSSEWLVQYSRDNKKIFYPRTIKELAIASEFGLVNKNNLLEIFNKYGISVEYPFIYKGNDVDAITKIDLLDFPIEGLGLTRQVYHSIAGNNQNLTILDLITREDLLSDLHPQVVEKINEIINRMNLEFVTDNTIER